MIGRTLSHYRILGKLGEGGQGEVYKAKDTRLNRTVAIKVLPAHLRDNPELRQRFQREAQAIAALEHPHICVLYDVGEHEGTDFLVMEYLEGETLAKRLEKGALPLGQVLRYAVEMADALERAHRHGIVHRDLKPGNVMLTKDGTKLLDFGLAKLRPAQAVAAMSAAPTAPAPLTDQGTILGTLSYMAPEQLEGQEADARTDLFAFGAIAYEMATGKKAFEGKSQASLISAIMSAEPPPISASQPLAPPALDRLIRKCLAKEAEKRWQTAADLADELQWVTEGGAQAGVSQSTLERSRRRERRWMSATFLLSLGLLVTLLLGVAYVRRASPPGEVVRFTLLPPQGTAFGGGAGAQGFSFALSPDGRRLTFVPNDPSGANILWVRALDSLAAQPLSGTEGARFPFWSPDSRSIGFFAQGKLRRIEVSGGPVQTVCEAPDGRGGAWNRGGTIVFARRDSGLLYRVAAAGGVAAALTTLDASRQERHQWPQFLPDGRHFIYHALAGPEGSGIYIGSLDSKEARRLLSTDVRAAYASGYLLFVREGSLRAQPLDARTMGLAGEPVPVAERVAYAGVQAAFSVSDTGVLVYRSGTGAISQLLWVDRDGKALGSVGEPADYVTPRLSPDEKRLAIERHDPTGGTGDLWLFDLARGIGSRFTFDGFHSGFAVWSPDGSRLIFSSGSGSPSPVDDARDLYQKSTSDSGKAEVLFKSGAGKNPTDWSSDGRFVLYETTGRNSDVWVLPLFGDRRPVPYLQTEFNERHGRFSPDRRWIAYASDESERFEVYVRSFQSPAGKWQISTRGGEAPRWRRDGKELFYLAPDNKIMAVAVKGDSAFEVGVSRALFEARIRHGPTPEYAVTADGQRFLLNTFVEQAAGSVTMVVNWSAGLKRE